MLKFAVTTGQAMGVKREEMQLLNMLAYNFDLSHISTDEQLC